jgi:hypothetical protein
VIFIAIARFQSTIKAFLILIGKALIMKMRRIL